MARAIDPRSGFKVNLDELVRDGQTGDMSGDMFPTFSPVDSPNTMASYSVKRGNFDLALPCGHSFANIGNSAFVEFGKMAFRALWRIPTTPIPIASAFRNHIPHVVHLGAREQVIGVHATRVIALMQNQFGAKRRIVNFVRNAVGKQGAMIIRNDAVTLRIKRAFPFPAIVGLPFVNFIPKMAGQAAKWLDFAHSGKLIPTLAARLWSKIYHTVDNNHTGLGSQGRCA